MYLYNTLAFLNQLPFISSISLDKKEEVARVQLDDWKLWTVHCVVPKDGLVITVYFFTEAEATTGHLL